ncbi:MAG: hypothetical protein ABI629_19920 [bacterium]
MARVPEPLRPLSFGQLIDAAARLVWAYPAALIGLAALPLAFFLPLFLLQALLLPELNGTAPDLEQFGPWLLQIIVGGIVFVCVLSVVWTVAIAAQTYASALARAAQPPAFVNACRVGWGLISPISWALFLIVGVFAIFAGIAAVLLIALASALGDYSMLTFAPLFLCIVAQLYLFARLALVVPVVVLERGVGMAALRRSATLMQGQVLRMIGIFLIVNLAITLVGGLIAASLIPLATTVPLLGSLATGLVQLGAQAIGSAINSALLVLLYFDIRSRVEGFDLEQLLQMTAAAASVTR